MSSPLLAFAWCAIAFGLLLSFRTARSAWRAGSVAEGLISVFFFGGAMGYALLLMRRTLGLSAEGFAPVLQVAELGFLLPPVTVTLFTWLVFRPETSWARSLAIALSTVAVTIHLARVWLGSSIGPEALFETNTGIALFWLAAATRAVCFGWACAEASAYYGKVRKQVTLGILDPLVANRFLLWACWSGITTVMLGLRIATPFLTNTQVDPPMPPTWLIVAQLVAGVSCALVVWLTFAPPRFYRRLVRRALTEA